MADHVCLHLDCVPVLAAINIDDRSAHLWDDDAVSEVGFDTLWPFTWWNILLGSSELLDESIILGAHGSLAESSLWSRSHQVDDLLNLHVQELVELNTSVDLLLKWLLLGLLFRHPCSL